MKIGLVTDRIQRRPDPVEAKEGVFAHLAEEELSEQEQARVGSIQDRPTVSRISENPDAPQHPWHPKQILKRLTKLYASLGRPKGKA